MHQVIICLADILLFAVSARDVRKHSLGHVCSAKRLGPAMSVHDLVQATLCLWSPHLDFWTCIQCSLGQGALCGVLWLLMLAIVDGWSIFPRLAVELLLERYHALLPP